MMEEEEDVQGQDKNKEIQLHYDQNQYGSFAAHNNTQAQDS